MNISEFYAQNTAFRSSALFKCCGSVRWVEGMLRQTPAEDMTTLLAQADHIWDTCGEFDWREAFSHHPRIGDIPAMREKFASTATWATQEQAGTQGATDEMLVALADLNHIYEDKFGFIFIVCAMGKSAEEMLELLQQRLTNSPEAELRIAAHEQLKITQLRLQKLFTS